MRQFLLLCLLVAGVCVGQTLGRRSNLVELDEDSWKQILTGEWMVKFHAPWCPACKSLKPTWDDFSKWSDDLSIQVGSIDVTTNPGLSGRFMVTARPTIYHVKDGVFRQYSGSRDTNTFSSFVEERKWEQIEPISSWKAPNSLQMSTVAYFFKVSMALRSVHNRLVDDYGIPYWGSYVLFALAIILVGVLLGLLIVCVIDLLVPGRPQYEQPPVGGDQSAAAPRPPKKAAPAEEEDDGLAEDVAPATLEAKKKL